MATLERTTGSSTLYDVLHADHEQVYRRIADLLGARDEGRAQRLWQRLAVELTLYVRGVQEVIVERLEGMAPERVEQARDALIRLEQRVSDAHEARPGPDFVAMVTELGQLLHRHARELEDLLAEGALGEDDQETLVGRFEDHDEAHRTAVEMEFGVGGVDVAWAEDVEEEREVGRPSQARSPKGGGDVAHDVSTTGARTERKARLTVVRASDLDRRTVTELYDLASARGLEVVRGMSRDELLEVLARAA